MPEAGGAMVGLGVGAESDFEESLSAFQVQGIGGPVYLGRSFDSSERGGDLFHRLPTLVALELCFRR